MKTRCRTAKGSVKFKVSGFIAVMISLQSACFPVFIKQKALMMRNVGFFVFYALDEELTFKAFVKSPDSRRSASCAAIAGDGSFFDMLSTIFCLFN